MFLYFFILRIFSYINNIAFLEFIFQRKKKQYEGAT